MITTSNPNSRKVGTVPRSIFIFFNGEFLRAPPPWKVVKDLDECGESWGRLAASSLDADAATLAQLAILQQAMISLARLYFLVTVPVPATTCTVPTR